MLTKPPNGHWIDLVTVSGVRPSETSSAVLTGLSPAYVYVTHGREREVSTSVPFDTYEAATSFADGLAERVNAAKAAARAAAGHRPPPGGSSPIERT